MKHREPRCDWKPPVEDAHDVQARHRHRLSNLLRRYQGLLNVPEHDEDRLLRRFENEKDAEILQHFREMVRAS